MDLSDYQEEIPKRLKNQLVYAERIVIARKNAVLVVITSEWQLLEVKERSVITAIDLGSFVGSGTDERSGVSSVFGTLPAPEPKVASHNGKIRLTVFRSSDGIERKIFYLLEIEKCLVVVERRSSPCVKLIHCQTIENYVKLEIADSIECPGFPVVKIYIEQQSEPIVTNFNAYQIESCGDSVNSFTCFHEVLKSLKDRTNERRAELAAIQTVSGELFEKMNKRLKQVPIYLRTENPDEKRPLVKYGDVWTKFHNELLVIGVPVFNCTYKRRLTLTNLRLKLFQDSNKMQRKFSYSYKYYQLNDDDHNFSAIDQILDAQESISEHPIFSQEWEQPSVNVLHSEQTALLVATIKMSNLDPLQLSTIYDIFVTYDVATVEPDFCDRLQLYLGSIEIRRTDLYQSNLAVAFNGRDTYKDLLTVTATSDFLMLELTFKNIPNRGFDRFCIETLKFRSVNFSSGTENMQKDIPNILYFDDNGYWHAMLIRLDELKSSRQTLKVYSRKSHQMLALLHAIYSEYEEECSIRLVEDRISTIMELKEGLLNELAAKIENPSDVREILLRELKTDRLYLNASS